jgi:hypothetical protein
MHGTFALAGSGSADEAGSMAGQQRQCTAVGTGARDRAGADGEAAHGRRPVVSTGNPRVTVAFPFSKVEVGERVDEIRDLAAMVWRLAEHVAVLARETVAEQAASAGAVAGQAGLLASRLGAAL